MYFDLAASHAPKKNNFSEFSWAYLHLPLVVSIAGVGAAMLNLIEHSTEDSFMSARYLLIGAAFVAIISISLILRTIQTPEEHQRIHKVSGRVTIISALAILPLAFLNISTILFLAILNVIMLAPIFFGIRIWIKEQTTNKG